VTRFRNDFKPHFSGRFVEVDGQIVLEGRFGLPPSAKAFMAFWFVLGLLWTVVVCFIFAQNPTQNWPFPLAGLGLLLGGVGIVKYGSWYSRDDAGWLAERIRGALTAPDQ
jgi:hypothetical protein